MQIRTFLKIGVLAILPLAALADAPSPSRILETQSLTIAPAIAAIKAQWSMRRPTLPGAKYLVTQWREI